ncbi:MAG: hypothetical protein J6T10_23060 [Methanobrevibacter sp.]|nr:hypothetical protein [Methanobrevibacter sp.]
MGRKDRKLQADIARLNHHDNQVRLEQEKRIANQNFELKKQELELKNKEFEAKDRVDVSKKEYLELLDYKEKYLELKSRFDSMEYNINNKLKTFENLPKNIINKIMFGQFDSVVLYNNPAGLKRQLCIAIGIELGE